MKPLIALDADGVLLDYNQAYAGAWERAFGVRPALRDPNAYWPLDRWNVERLAGTKLDQFRTCLDWTFWSTVPALPGAREACERLVAAGYRLVCVSAIRAEFAEARRRNLEALGCPLEDFVATGNAGGDVSPKAAALQRLRPMAFVDDYLPYHRGVDPSIHKALIRREPNGSPSHGPELTDLDSTHDRLDDFTEYWLGRFHRID